MPHRVLTAQQVAEYLHLTPAEVEHLVKRGKIPHEKSGSRVVFRRIDIDAWASRRLLETRHGDEKFVEDFHQRASAKRFEFSQEHALMPDLLTAERIDADLGARTRPSVISEMVALAGDTGLVNDPVDLLESLRNREELCSTAMPGGFALLHPRHHHEYLFEESFIVFGRTAHPVGFGAPDGHMTDLFFLVCCGDDRLHLHTIARICAMYKETALITQLRTAETAGEMYDLIVAAEMDVIRALRPG